MYWCVIHAKHGRCQEIIEYFNRQDNVCAFVPKIEKWFSGSQIKEYQISSLYPDYIFVKTSLGKDEFNEKYKEVLQSIKGFADLLEYKDIIALETCEKELLEKMLDDCDTIKHSIGHIINSVLTVEQGPLVGLEKQVKKIDRHKRIAFLDCGILGRLMKVPLEVVSKT